LLDPTQLSRDQTRPADRLKRKKDWKFGVRV